MSADFQSCTDMQVDGKPETYCCAGCTADDIDGYADSLTEHYANDPGVPYAKQRVVAVSCCLHRDAMEARLRDLPHLPRP